MAWAEKLPSGRYRGVYRDGNGKRRSVGETYSHKARAERAAAALEGKVRRSMHGDPDAAKRTWGEWCDEWWPTRSVEGSTLSTDGSRRKVHLDPRWAKVPVGSIRRHDVKEWAAAMRRRGTGASTVQRAVHLLSASLAAAVDAEIIEANPAARLSLPKGAQEVERFLTREEFAAVVEQLPTSRDRLVAYTLAYTGLRWGEMAGLHRNRVDLDRGVLRVVETWEEKTGVISPYPKGKKARDVPIPGWLVELLAAEAGPKGGRCGIPHTSGRCSAGLMLTTLRGTVLRNTNWRDTFARAVEDAGLEHVRIHDLRHTYASWLIQSGVDLARVGKLMGHVSTATTQKYAHLDEIPSDTVLAALAAPLLPHETIDKA